jgi:hypothetical protein
MQQLEFENWWKEFQSYHEKDNDNGSREYKELLWTLNSFSKEKQIAFIDELQKNKHPSYACELIPIYGNTRQLNHLRTLLLFNLIFKSKRTQIDYIVIAILKSYRKTDYLLLKLFSILRNDYSSAILEAMFEANKKLFIINFNKMLDKYSEIKYDRFKHLINRTDVNRFLKENLTDDKMALIENFKHIRN